MKIVGEIDLKGIKKIVINRTIVWELEDRRNTDDDTCEPIWRKISGGKGFDPHLMKLRNHKLPADMMEHINQILAMSGQCTSEKTMRAYRCWPSGDTLNIVRKDLP